MSSSSATLSLYRKVLRAARLFPSINRENIYKEIRLEYRKNKNLTDPKVIEEKREYAKRGLKELQRYSVDSYSFS